MLERNRSINVRVSDEEIAMLAELTDGGVSRAGFTAGPRSPEGKARVAALLAARSRARGMR